MNTALGNGETDVPTSDCSRPMDPRSVPLGGRTISTVDLDVTVACNLRCDYCFKEKHAEYMPLETAKQAVAWLIHASDDVNQIRVNLIGGEPLMAWPLIRELVPFAKQRASQHGKNIHFSITTNGTIISTEILEFWRKWGMGFHCSIDGSPESHDRHRFFANGKGSSELLARNLPQILAVRPWTTARSTVLPDTVFTLAESFDYLLGLGFRDVAMVPGNNRAWDNQTIRTLEQQYRLIKDRVAQLFRQGCLVRVKYFNEVAHALAAGGAAPGSNCGAGKGIVLIDVKGNIWPCHRWSKQAESPWRLGSIFESWSNREARQQIEYESASMATRFCLNCPASFACQGGCPAENFEDTGQPFLRDRRGCDITRAITGVAKVWHDEMKDERNPLFWHTYYAEKEKRGATNSRHNKG